MSGFPVARPGQSVGLLGGSFDPAHEGHVHVTREALRRLGLDRVWWLVSPGNPLKADGPAPLELRMKHAREVMEHPDVVVTDLEARLNTRFTADTLEALQTRYEGVRFVWLMGADNLAQFHLWRDWERIFGMAPIAVFARPGQGLQARTSPAARRFRSSLRPEHEARGLAAMQPPAWVFIDMPMHPASSTEIRDRGDWNHE